MRAAPYDDVYSSRDGALEEARAVFLSGSGLPQRWLGRRHFTIGELGFGTGLNALATWDLWRRTKSDGALLHYVSIEGHPLERADAARVLGAYPELAPLSARLLDRWPVRSYGLQRLWFEDGFCLTIAIDDATAALVSLEGPVDAWFLDGFAPARNPAMWSDSVMAHIGRLSAPDATAATYSVAGVVRRGLEGAGFEVSRAKGFGGKRERLEAIRLGGFTEAPPSPNRIAIVGGGIAGACLAHALGRRGVRPLLLCGGADLADGASGNPAGLVMPRLDRDPGAASAMFRQAYLAALDLYRTETSRAFLPCGVMQRPDSARAGQAYLDLLADPPLGADHLGPAGDCGLFHRGAGMLDPAKAIADLARSAEVRLRAPIAGISPEGGCWVLRGPEGQLEAEAEAVVLAAGAGLRGWPQTAWLPMPLSAGQVNWAAHVSAAVAQVRGCYVGPMPRGGIVFGASFDPTDQTLAGPTPAATAANLDRLRELDPALAAAVADQPIAGRASVRATTPDRLPLMGVAPRAADWETIDLAAGPRWDGLFLFGGLGARGLTLAPLLAEALASRVLGEASPLSASAAAILDPARFLIRARKRGETLVG